MKYFRKHFLHVILLLIVVSKEIPFLYGQKIVGKYHRDRDSFEADKEHYFHLGFYVENPCQGGYCIVNYGHEGKALIDTSGNIVEAMDGSIKVISLHATPHGVYKNRLSSRNDWELSRLKGNPLKLSSKKPHIYLSSDSMGDYFFRERYLSFSGPGQIVYGDIILIGKDSISTISKDQTFYHGGLSDEPRAKRYFLRGLLITPKKDGQIFIQDLRLRNLFSDLKIIDLCDLNEFVFITRSAEGYNLIQASDHIHPIDSFDWYKIENLNYSTIIYRKNTKYGAYVCGLRKTAYRDSVVMLNFYKFEAVYDSIYRNPKEYDMLRMLKGDTLLIYLYSDFRDFPVNKVNYNEAFKVRRSGKLHSIGYNGRFYSEDRRSFTKSDLIPNTIFLGSNWTRMTYTNVNKPDTFDVYATSLEAGFGWYDYGFDDGFISTFDLAGGGISLEYRIPFAHAGRLSEKTGKKYQHLFLNARMEMSAGFAVGNLGLGVNLQLAYSTDFTHHFARPGIGLSTLNVQLGAEVYIPVGKEFLNQYWMSGFYFRYLFLEDF